VHSNLEALEAVLGDARRRGFEQVVCLGDLVGYAASPNQVVERVRELEPVVIRGNHDKAIAGIDSAEQFNHLALQSCTWTRAELTGDNLRYLAELPVGPRQVDDRFWIAHGTPLDEDAYILNDLDALEVFRCFTGQVCFFGHSHIPTVFGLSDEEDFFVMYPLDDEERLVLKPGCRYLINCGSVGQPRDRNPKAAYGIYDSASQTVGLYRVAYPVEETQRRILDTHLPRFLSDRLGLGV
jgi:diadenosine tetraphosphatase ApaH/serine/threonine PP2A family protein phosphatase